MPTLPNMGLITPTLGGDSGTWDDKINAAFALVDAHDHTSGKGVRVPVAGLNINADFAMAGYAVTGLGSIAFNAVTALASGSKRLFVSSADNELYWRSNAGVNVKLTSGSSINTTLVGGIVGDYSTVGAALTFADADKVYTHKTQTATWARLASGPVRIYEYNTSESVYVEHAVAAALAASYTVTWPAALPALGPVAIQISAAGAVSFSNTFTRDVTATDFWHTSPHFLPLPASAALDRLGTHTKQTGATSGATNRYLLAASANPLVWPILLPQGSVITAYTIYITKNTSNTNTVSARLYKTVASTATETALGAACQNAENATGAGRSLGETGLSIAIGNADDEQFYLVLAPGGSVAPAADEVYSATITYTRPS